MQDNVARIEFAYVLVVYSYANASGNFSIIVDSYNNSE